MNTHITIETFITSNIRKVWDMWNEPEHIKNWMFASDDWECTQSTNDVRVGGTFSNTLGAKDKSVSFDVLGTYTSVEEEKFISYTMSDGRRVTVAFEEAEGGVRVIETFEPENENPEEVQRAGWQAILDNFKKYVETPEA